MKKSVRREAKMTIAILRKLANVAEKTAEAGAGLASFHGQHQPKVPESLRK